MKKINAHFSYLLKPVTLLAFFCISTRAHGCAVVEQRKPLILGKTASSCPWLAYRALFKNIADKKTTNCPLAVETVVSLMHKQKRSTPPATPLRRNSADNNDPNMLSVKNKHTSLELSHHHLLAALADVATYAIQQAIIAYERCDFIKAKELFEEAEKQEFNDMSKAWALIWLAKINAFTDPTNMQAAHDYFQSALAQNKCKEVHTYALAGLSLVNFERKQYGEAENLANQVIALKNNESAIGLAYVCLGHVAEQNEDTDTALTYYLKATNQHNDRDAQLIAWVKRLDLYCAGQGEESTVSEGQAFLKSLPHHTSLAAYALRTMGVYYYEKLSDPIKAFQCFSNSAEKALDQSDRSAALALCGDLYYSELTNPEEARKHYEMALTASDDLDRRALIYYRLGLLYRAEGNRASVDQEKKMYRTAKKSLKKALEHNNEPAVAAAAQFALGDMYYKGEGRKKIRRAHKCFEKVYVQNDDIVFKGLGAFSLGVSYMTGEGIERDYAKALFYFTFASQQNIPEEYKVEIHRWLGEIYYHGYSVPVDYTEARTHFEKAVNQDINEQTRAWGCTWLGKIYFQGNGVDKNYATAKKYLHQADKPTHSLSVQIVAWYTLGEIYSLEGSEESKKRSIDYFKKAADQAEITWIREAAIKKLEASSCIII